MRDKEHWRGGPSLKPRSLTPGDAPAAPDTQKVTPLPPDPIPGNPLSLDLPPKDYREYIMRERLEAWKRKTMLRSRTIVTIAVTIASFILVKMLGLDVDLGTLIDPADGLQLGELLWVVGAVLAAFFRKHARVDLSKPSNG